MYFLLVRHVSYLSYAHRIQEPIGKTLSRSERSHCPAPQTSVLINPDFAKPFYTQLCAKTGFWFLKIGGTDLSIATGPILHT